VLAMRHPRRKSAASAALPTDQGYSAQQQRGHLTPAGFHPPNIPAAHRAIHTDLSLRAYTSHRTNYIVGINQVLACRTVPHRAGTVSDKISACNPSQRQGPRQKYPKL
jgi:hypothetical protein